MSDFPQQSTPKKRPRWAKAFIAALSESANVRLACAATGIDRKTAYNLRNSDSTFADEWDTALTDAADLLEAEARRRALSGVQRVKFDRGKPILVPLIGADGLPIRGPDGAIEMIPYVEHEYSDTLLIFLLKGALPEKYRERSETKLTFEPVDWDAVPNDIRDAFIDGRIKLDDVYRILRTAGA